MGLYRAELNGAFAHLSIYGSNRDIDHCCLQLFNFESCSCSWCVMNTESSALVGGATLTMRSD